MANKANPHLHKSTSCLKVKQQVRFTHFLTSEAEAVAAIFVNNCTLLTKATRYLQQNLDNSF